MSNRCLPVLFPYQKKNGIEEKFGNFKIFKKELLFFIYNHWDLKSIEIN